MTYADACRLTKKYATVAERPIVLVTAAPRFDAAAKDRVKEIEEGISRIEGEADFPVCAGAELMDITVYDPEVCQKVSKRVILIQMIVQDPLSPNTPSTWMARMPQRLPWRKMTTLISRSRLPSPCARSSD